MKPRHTRRTHFHRRRTPTAFAVAVALWQPMAALPAPMSLSNAPAGSQYRPPAPNVIVTLDDSGSMGGSYYDAITGSSTTGMTALKAAVQDAFSEANMPDGSIRLGWNMLNRCTRLLQTMGNRQLCENTAGQPENAIRVLDSAHRALFLQRVDALTPIGATPTHGAYTAAGDYYLHSSTTDVNSPWASVPGTTLEPVLSCRRAYNVLLTDGSWNDINVVNDGARGMPKTPNPDGTTRTLPDGTAYDTTRPETRIYRDNWGGDMLDGLYGPPRGIVNSLSDLAFYYWATDLTGLPRKVKPLIRQAGSQSVSSGSTTVSIPEYWNPKNDPATWQHMSTYTIGFRDAAQWLTQNYSGYGNFSHFPVWGGSTYAGSYPDLLAGTKTWPDPVGPQMAISQPGGGFTWPTDPLITEARKTEMWHMALNGRGKFFPANNAQDLTLAFRDILNEIVQDNTVATTSLSASASNTLTASKAFATRYDAEGWSGRVTAYTVAAGTGELHAGGAWGTTTSATTGQPEPASTASLMDASAFSPTDRVVLSWRGATTGSSGTAASGIAWTWDNLNDTQKAELNTASSGGADALGADRLAYLRGDRSKEAHQTPAGPFRTRTSRHGDIVNSAVWYTPGKPQAGHTDSAYATFRSNNASRDAMIYVGANDGMLHGFDAATGEERIAYVPDGLHATLPALTRPGYAHRYYVDGSPFTADAQIGANWKTYLAGFPGLGARGYFVLDVTDPSAANFTATNAASLVVLDKTRASTLDADVGHIIGKPVTRQTDASQAMQITKLNNNRWALVMGNGYNSASEKAVLLIQYLDGAKELLKLSADSTEGTGNGLAPPQLVDLNGDRIPDVAYAGDLKGRLWKFNLHTSASSGWGVAFGGDPLFTATTAAATGASGTAQPITAAPSYIFHPEGGVLVAFGTGRHLTDADRTDAQAQTLYGVWDTTRHSGTEDGLALSGGTAITTGRAALVAQTVSSSSTATSASGNELWTVSSNPVPYTGEGAKRGWYIDLPVSKERTLEASRWLEGNLFRFPSTVPASGANVNQESCDPPSTAHESYLTTVNLLNGAAPRYALFAYATPPAANTGNPSRAKDPSGGTSTTIKAGGDTPKNKCIAGPGVNCDDLNSGGFTSQRATWRQAQ